MNHITNKSWIQEAEMNFLCRARPYWRREEAHHLVEVQRTAAAPPNQKESVEVVWIFDQAQLWTHSFKALLAHEHPIFPPTSRYSFFTCECLGILQQAWKCLCENRLLSLNLWGCYLNNTNLDVQRTIEERVEIKQVWLYTTPHRKSWIVRHYKKLIMSQTEKNFQNFIFNLS